MPDPVLPSWAEELKARFQNGSATSFLLHGAIDDLQPWAEPEGATAWLESADFLARFLGRSRTVVSWSPRAGLAFSSAEGEAEIRERVALRRKATGQSELGAWPREGRAVLGLLRSLVGERGLRLALVIESVELLAPAESWWARSARRCRVRARFRLALYNDRVEGRSQVQMGHGAQGNSTEA